MSKCGLSRALSDAAHYEIKSMLLYKAIRHGIDYKVVSERFSSITCSECFARSGPKGLSGLRIRAWECSSCRANHDRDVNAAKNILRSLRGIVGFKESLKIA
jgi:putative transposase